MHEGKNMGIMITLKKPTAESSSSPRVGEEEGVRDATNPSRPSPLAGGRPLDIGAVQCLCKSHASWGLRAV